MNYIKNLNRRHATAIGYRNQNAWYASNVYLTSAKVSGICRAISACWIVQIATAVTLLASAPTRYQDFPKQHKAHHRGGA
jgi:hypothetical protein